MTFSPAASVRFGWETFTKRPWFFAGLTALMIVASWFVGALAGAFTGDAVQGLVGTIITSI